MRRAFIAFGVPAERAGLPRWVALGHPSAATRQGCLPVGTGKAISVLLAAAGRNQDLASRQERHQEMRTALDTFAGPACFAIPGVQSCDVGGMTIWTFHRLSSKVVP